MVNNDLNEFMNSQEKVPTALYAETLKLTQVSLNPKPLLLKFFSLNILGGFGTLAICPQYGFGPFAFSAGIMNVIMSYGPVVCGVFCASIFFLGGHLLSFAFLDRAERKWVSRHGYAMIIPYVSFIFMLGMGLKSISPGHIHHDVISYYGSWFVTAVAISILFVKVVSGQKISARL
jgi:hypothetical protein